MLPNALWETYDDPLAVTIDNFYVY